MSLHAPIVKFAEHAVVGLVYRFGRLPRKESRQATSYPGRRSVGAGDDETGVVRDDRCLDPVACGELHEDPADVGLDCRLGNEHRCGDLLVRTPPCDHLQDFALASGQRLDGTLSRC